MSHELDPKVGRWYQRLDDEQLFKVLSIDEDDGLIEIRTVDGEVEELDSTEWVELDLEAAEPPEDYRDPDGDGDDDDDLDEDKDKEKDEDDEDERPSHGRSGRGSRSDWDDDDDDDDWDDDDDDGDDDDSDR